MKQLMIAVAVVCAAVASQAATLKWGDGDLSYNKEAAGANVTLTTFYFGTDAKAQEIYQTILALGAENGSKYIYNNVSDGTLTVSTEHYTDEAFAAYSTGTFSEGSKFGSTVKSIVTGTTYYFASLITAEGDAGVEAYIGNVGSFTAEGNNKSYDKMGTLWNGEKGTESVAWQSVPEPTSGLLLLLGVAGLALRRRRA